MRLSAVIFDVYQTLIEVGPPPEDAAERWIALCRETLGIGTPPTLEAVSGRCREVVAADHTAGRSYGIAYPEVHWESVLTRALPALKGLEADARAKFIVTHVQLLRSVDLSRGAISVLQRCRAAGMALGIASNAQPYSLTEFDQALSGSGVTRGWFDPALCIWSFENGFSKPDPYVFRLLATRLGLRGIAPGEAMMVGDRMDNDVEPARAQGFHTWLLTAEASGDGAGNWEQLMRVLDGAVQREGADSQSTS